ncbi:pilus-associated protein [Neisseria meningitidis]|nr:pilus-associated protein [Neisseria meningitidis]
MNKTLKRRVFRHTALYAAILMFSHTGGGGGKPFRIRAAPYVPPCVLEHILSLKSCFAGYRRRQVRRKRRDSANRPIPRPPNCWLENPFGPAAKGGCSEK